MMMKLTPWVEFTNVLQADTKSAYKDTDDSTAFLRFWDLCS